MVLCFIRGETLRESLSDRVYLKYMCVCVFGIMWKRIKVLYFVFDLLDHPFFKDRSVRFLSVLSDDWLGFQWTFILLRTIERGLTEIQNVRTLNCVHSFSFMFFLVITFKDVFSELKEFRIDNCFLIHFAWTLHEFYKGV